MEIYHFSADLLQIIEETADGAVRGADDEASLARSVLELSDAFVGRAAWPGEYASRPDLRRAYLRYYLPVNLPKLGVPLAAWRASAPPGSFRERLRCLDLGSGPGTALLGVVDFLRALPAGEQPKRLELVAIDQSYESLKDAETLLERFAERSPGISIAFQPLRSDLVADRADLFPIAAAGGRFDLVIAANVLCEIARAEPSGFEQAVTLVGAAAERLLSPNGTIVLVEPGLRETSRDLSRLRDRLLEDRRLHVIAPCLHEAPCPALATDRDWCITDLPWDPPASIREIDRRTGLRKGSLKFSYLVLRAAPPSPVEPGRWRLVSDVLDLKGEQRVYLCGDDRWIVLGRLKRDGADAFDGIGRGDLVEVIGMERKGSLFRLPPSGSIRKISDQTDP